MASRDDLQSVTQLPVLSETEFMILRDLIQERTGLYYQNNKRDVLEDKLQPLVSEKGFRSFLDYYYLLKYDSENAKEWQLLVDKLRVPETFFWREVEQLKALTQVIIPSFYAKKPIYPLRIWSAACSSGEEPLSIAMALHEGGWFGRFNIEIVASDISKTTIEKAQQGLYRNYALHKLPTPLREKYFRPQQDLWRIDPALIARIRWTTANLTVKTDVKRLAGADIIYCRNVFIYFSESMIRQIIDNFYDEMPTPGYLFVGISESLLKYKTNFQLQEIGKVFVYAKQP